MPCHMFVRVSVHMSKRRDWSVLLGAGVLVPHERVIQTIVDKISSDPVQKKIFIGVWI